MEELGKKKWWKSPWFLTILCFPVFIILALLLGKDGDKGVWESIKAGIESVWHTALTIGGVYGLLIATKRGKAADTQAIATQDQAKAMQGQLAAAQSSNQAQRYAKASEMLWHRVPGMRESGCYALKSLGLEDVSMAIQCRDLLVSFIRQQKEEGEPKPQCQMDNIAADRALSAFYEEWHSQKEFLLFTLTLPNWFWQISTSSRNYRKADLRGADLTNAYLSSADLRSAQLYMVDLSGAKLCSADLSKWISEPSGPTNLICANLSSANLDHADLSEADLSGAYLSGTKLCSAKLCRADLSEANFGYYANGTKTALSGLSSADLRSADLSSADLSEADLSGVILSSANLRGAKLIGADLINALLDKADLTNADFRGDGTNKQAAKNLSTEEILSAVWDRNIGPPLFPDDLKVDVNDMGKAPQREV